MLLTVIDPLFGIFLLIVFGTVVQSILSFIIITISNFVLSKRLPVWNTLKLITLFCLLITIVVACYNIIWNPNHKINQYLLLSAWIIVSCTAIAYKLKAIKFENR